MNEELTREEASRVAQALLETLEELQERKAEIDAEIRAARESLLQVMVNSGMDDFSLGHCRLRATIRTDYILDIEQAEIVAPEAVRIKKEIDTRRLRALLSSPRRGDILPFVSEQRRLELKRDERKAADSV